MLEVHILCINKQKNDNCKTDIKKEDVSEFRRFPECHKAKVQVTIKKYVSKDKFLGQLSFQTQVLPDVE